nr:MAG TPA: hypothetical protein [Caudoviricetes sp.]
MRHLLAVVHATNLDTPFPGLALMKLFPQLHLYFPLFLY